MLFVSLLGLAYFLAARSRIQRASSQDPRSESLVKNFVILLFGILMAGTVVAEFTEADPQALEIEYQETQRAIESDLASLQVRMLEQNWLPEQMVQALTNWHHENAEILSNQAALASHLDELNPLAKSPVTEIGPAQQRLDQIIEDIRSSAQDPREAQDRVAEWLETPEGGKYFDEATLENQQIAAAQIPAAAPVPKLPDTPEAAKLLAILAEREAKLDQIKASAPQLDAFAMQDLIGTHQAFFDAQYREISSLQQTVRLQSLKEQIRLNEPAEH